MKTSTTAIEKWIESHSYLKEVGALPLAIAKELEEADLIAKMPDLDSVLDKFNEGIPLLETEIDFNLDKIAADLLIKLGNLAKVEDLPKQVREFAEKLTKLDKKQAESLINAVIKGDKETLEKESSSLKVEQDIMLYFIWSSIRMAFNNITDELEDWIYEKNWKKSVCPVCGSHPVTSLLKRTKRGRERFLHCDHCGTNWGTKRIGCPYCDNIDQKTLSVKDTEDEPDVRLDLCHKCKQYIKTYVGTDKESAGISDWASIHLDLLMKDSGFKKKAGLIKLG